MKQIACLVVVVGLCPAGCRTAPFQSVRKGPSVRESDQPSDRPWNDNESKDSEAGDSPLRGLFANRFSLGSDPAARGVDRRLKTGHLAYRDGQLDEAKSAYLEVLRDDPDNASAHHRLAVIADRQQDFPTAEMHYAAALRKRSNDADLLSDYGYSKFLQGDESESARYLKAALEIDPRHRRALYNLGWLYGRQGRTELAYEHFRRAGTEQEARVMMARLARAGSRGASSRIAANSASQADRSSLRAPSPYSAGRDSNRSAAGTGRGTNIEDINYRLKQMMNRERRRQLTQRSDRNRRRPAAGFPNQLGPDADDGRSPDRSLQPGRRFSTDEPRAGAAVGSVYDRGTRNPSRFVADRPDNGSTQRLSRYGNRRKRSDELPADHRLDSPNSLSRRSDRDRHNNNGNTTPWEDHRETRNRSNLWPPDDPDTRHAVHAGDSPPSGVIRRATSRREFSRDRYGDRNSGRAGDRSADRRSSRQSGRFTGERTSGIDPSRREALRLGHNAGSGGVLFPLPADSSRFPQSERRLRRPDRPVDGGENPHEALLPTPDDGGDRRIRRRADAGVPFDGPVIQPATKRRSRVPFGQPRTPETVGGGYSPPDGR